MRLFSIDVRNKRAAVACPAFFSRFFSRGAVRNYNGMKLSLLLLLLHLDDKALVINHHLHVPPSCLWL